MKIQIAAIIFLISLLSACSLPQDIPAPPPEQDSAACLQGEWEMSNAELNLMLATLVPVPGMGIPVGTFRITFIEDDFLYYSDGFVLRLDMPEGYLEAEATFETGGTFTAEDGRLNLADIVSSKEVSTWRAVKGDLVVEVPGDIDVSVPLPGNGPYTCDANTLTITSPSPTGDPFPMVFQR